VVSYGYENWTAIIVLTARTREPRLERCGWDRRFLLPEQTPAAHLPAIAQARRDSSSPTSPWSPAGGGNAERRENRMRVAANGGLAGM